MQYHTGDEDISLLRNLGSHYPRLYDVTSHTYRSENFTSCRSGHSNEENQTFSRPRVEVRLISANTFSDWFTVPFFTFHFNNVGSTCNLRLIFINGLVTPVSWVSDFQKAVLIDVTGLYKLRRSYCVLKIDSLYFVWRQARDGEKVIPHSELPLIHHPASCQRRAIADVRWVSSFISKVFLIYSILFFSFINTETTKTSNVLKTCEKKTPSDFRDDRF